MIVILMGVSGSGKSTIGRQLAEQLGWPFYDGDDFHPPANIEKMAGGIALTDDDRAAWLATLAGQADRLGSAGQSGVIACSALKQAYRRVLQGNTADVRFVYLKGSYDLILARLQARQGHYMKPEMLKSQFDALEEPQDTLVIDVAQSPAAIVAEIIQVLEL